MFFMLFCLVSLFCPYSCRDIRGWRRSLLNVPGTASFDTTRPVSWKNAQNITHFYKYYQEIFPEDSPWVNRKTWQTARGICSSYSSRPSGCYLIEPDTLAETVTFLNLIEDDLYGKNQWTNFFLEESDIYSGLTQENVSFPHENNTQIPDNQFTHDIALKFGHSHSYLFSPVSMSVPMNFFCECEDICQPGLLTCRNPCCRDTHEQCTNVDDVTAICSCPPRK